MKKLSLVVISLAMLIAGCASVDLSPEAARVIASPNPAPKGCRYMGQVNGNQGNFFTGAYTSNQNLEQGAMNDLKNQAAKLGGNYIQMITNRAGNTGSESSGFGGSMMETNVTNMGNVYKCSPKAIGLE